MAFFPSSVVWKNGFLYYFSPKMEVAKFRIFSPFHQIQEEKKDEVIFAKKPCFISS
jgi:hypothetical protein